MFPGWDVQNFIVVIKVRHQEKINQTKNVPLSYMYMSNKAEGRQFLVFKVQVKRISADTEHLYITICDTCQSNIFTIMITTKLTSAEYFLNKMWFDPDCTTECNIMHFIQINQSLYNFPGWSQNIFWSGFLISQYSVSVEGRYYGVDDVDQSNDDTECSHGQCCVCISEIRNCFSVTYDEDNNNCHSFESQ